MLKNTGVWLLLQLLIPVACPAYGYAGDLCGSPRVSQLLVADCRHGEIFVGWNSSVAVAFHTSVYDLELTVIQIQHSSGDTLPSVVASKPRPFYRGPMGTQIHWTRNDNVMIVEPTGMTFAKIDTLDSKMRIDWRHVSPPPHGFFGHKADRLPPIQVVDSVLFARSTADRKAVRFSSQTGQFHTIDAVIEHGDILLWNGGNLLSRVHLGPASQAPSFDIFDWKLKRWRKFNLPPFSSSLATIPLLIRPNNTSDVELVILQPNKGTKSARILAWRAGTRAFRTLAEGNMKRVVLSPSGEDVYGFFRPDGRFQIVADRQRSPEVNFWLSRFAETDGLIDFGIFDRARAAIVKRQVGQNVRISVFIQQNLKSVREIYSLHESKQVDQVEQSNTRQ